MNLFEQADTLKSEAEKKARKGSSASLHSTVTIPYFKGLYRKGEAYTAKAVNVYEHKGMIEGADLVNFKVKPLTGSFIISYFVCLAYTICKDNTKQVGKKIVPDPKPLTVYVVQALISSEGFSLDDYAQGKVKGFVRIASHLKAIAEQRKLSISVDEKSGEIKGLTDEIVESVLSAI